jgi:HlyD family secretion protein
MAAEPAFRIIEGGAVELQADVVDATLARFESGQSVRVSTTGAAEPLDGTIRLIPAEVDPATRLGRLRVALPLDAKVTIGSFASGVVEVGRQTAVTVPISAITVSDAKSTVQVVTDNKIQTREVEIGLRSPTRAEVKSGLAENELVVARAGSFLRDGDAVSPVEANGAEASR